MNKYPIPRIALSVALGLGLTACQKDNPPPPPKQEQSFYPTWLEQNLATGICRNLVALWGEGDRIPAQTYVESNGQPTAACPNPETRIAVVCDPETTTGDMLGGSFVIRYAFVGGGPACQDDFVSI